LQLVISPFPGITEPLDGRPHKDKGTWIYQDAWFHLGTFDAGRDIQYDLKKKGDGIYLFVIEGAFLLDGHRLETRDGLGITDTDTISLKAAEAGSRILIMEVPMENNIL
jgi:redox-sensitive bicupin YhaK (pirin superfamily)